MPRAVSLVSLADTVSEKSYRFSIDDNIRFFRDLALSRPASIFDNAYMALLYRLHERYETRFQLNVYYESERFTLAQMPDVYRSEWLANAGWLRLSFHARADRPADPYQSAGYAQVRGDCEAVHAELRRFAGEALMSGFTTLHFVTATREGCRALADCGYRGLIALCRTYDGAPRLSYYLDAEAAQFLDQNGLARDPETGMIFVRNDLVLNALPAGEIRPRLDALHSSGRRSDFLEVMIHEQYFYPDYSRCLPDFAAHMETAILWLRENGHRSVFLDEIL